MYLILEYERAVTHARIWLTDIVGGATAMSFGKKNSRPTVTVPGWSKVHDGEPLSL